MIGGDLVGASTSYETEQINLHSRKLEDHGCKQAGAPQKSNNAPVHAAERTFKSITLAPVTGALSPQVRTHVR